MAWAKHLGEFAEIQALILHQRLAGRSIGERFSKVIAYDRLDQAVLERTGLHPE